MYWTTTTEFVDVETGEVITARHVEVGHYVKLKLKTKYERKNKDYGYRRNTWYCERNRQTEIIFTKNDKQSNPSNNGAIQHKQESGTKP